MINFLNKKIKILNIYISNYEFYNIIISLLYSLSFIFPNQFCFFSFLNLKYIPYNNFKLIIIKELIKFISLTITFNLWIYKYIYKKIIVFQFYLLLIINIILINYFILLFFSKLNKYKILKNKKLILIFINNTYYTLINIILYYYIGFLFTKGCICPIYYTITPLAIHKNFLPFFKYFNPWTYLFIINLIFKLLFEYFKIKKILISAFIVFLGFNILSQKSKKSFYYKKYSFLNLKKVIIKNKNKKIFIFPEEFIPISKSNDIERIKTISKKYKLTIFIGAILNFIENNYIQERNCVLTIINGELVEIKKKKHLLRFCESKNSKYKLFNKCKIKIKKSKYNVKICSEILLNIIKKHKKKLIIVSSKAWTNNKFTFLYKNIMNCLKNIHLIYNN